MTDTEPVTGLLAAMLAVQTEAPALPKDATNPHFRSKYVSLGAIVETIGPLLAKHDLVWSTKPSYDETSGEPTLKYKLAHSPSREVEEGEMKLLLAKPDAQGQGSAITYARRYALVSILNLVADDDDDGHAATTATPQASAATDATGGSRASTKQLGFLRSLAKRSGVTPPELVNLLRATGLQVPDGAKDLTQYVDALTPRQASSIIDLLQEGPVKTGGTDAPTDPSDFTNGAQE